MNKASWSNFNFKT